MKTLQQAIDALDLAELKKRKRRFSTETRRTDPHGNYYFPGGPLTIKERLTHEGYPRRVVDRHVDRFVMALPEYRAWAKDPGNVTLYVALFYAANHLKP